MDNGRDRFCVAVTLFALAFVACIEVGLQYQQSDAKIGLETRDGDFNVEGPKAIRGSCYSAILQSLLNLPCNLTKVIEGGVDGASLASGNASLSVTCHSDRYQVFYANATQILAQCVASTIAAVE